MQINEAMAANMTLEELFLAIEILTSDELNKIKQIILNKMQDIITENQELRRELKENSSTYELDEELLDLQDRLDKINQLSNY